MILSSILEKEKLKQILKSIDLNSSLVRSYNIRPGESISIVTSEIGTIETAIWGFIRSGMQNIRIPVVEQIRVHTKPTFRMSFRSQRCLILADSFYLLDQDNIPYRFLPVEDTILLIPGVYDYNERSREFNCCAIVRRARHSIERYSSMEPVCIEYKRWRDWICDEKVENLIEVLNRTSLQPLQKYRVSNKLLIRGFSKPILHQPVSTMPSLF